MRRVFLGLAALMLLATGILFFLAGMGAFDTAPRSESFEPHRMVGRGLFVVSLLAIGVAALARVPGRVIGLTALISGLVLLQSLIGFGAGAFGDTGESTAAGNVVFGLHAVNGLITMGVARSVFRRARSLAARPREVAPAAPAPVGA